MPPTAALSTMCLALTVLASTALGCVAEPAGDEIGTYRITMKLTHNTCGASAVNLQDGRAYTAQLRADGAQALWRLPGQMPINGSYEDGEFKVAYSSIVAKSTPDAGAVCQLLQEEVLEGAADLAAEVDAGSADAGTSTPKKTAIDSDAGLYEDEEFEAPKDGLAGRHTLTIKALSGTDCRDALSPEGPFERLPCTVRYDLIGQPTESF